MDNRQTITIDDKEFESSSDESSSDDFWNEGSLQSVNTSCILEFYAALAPSSQTMHFKLRALPYVVRANPFENLEQSASMLNGWLNSDEQDFYNLFSANNIQDILNIIKLLQKNHVIINNKNYSINCYGFISGSLLNYIQPNQFEPHHINVFCSCVDLIVRDQVRLNEKELQLQIRAQKEKYDLVLSDTEQAKIIAIFRKHSIKVREQDIKKYQLKAHQEVKSPVQHTYYIASYINHFIFWLNDHLNYLMTRNTAKSAPNPKLSLADKANLKEERNAIINRFRKDAYADTFSQKQDLKRLIQLRFVYEWDENFEARVYDIAHQSFQFWNSIDKPECWQDPEINLKVKQIMIENILISDEILANMEAFIRDAGFEPSSERIASLLANQDFLFCRLFICSGLIDFYAKYREKGWSEASNITDGKGNPYKVFRKQNERDTNRLFFTKNSEENALRKIYNTFIQHGFYQYYENTVDNTTDALNFKACLWAKDPRFVLWTPLDKKIHQPRQETWVQFFQRKIYDRQDLVLEEHYTYTHPFSSTRPT